MDNPLENEKFEEFRLEMQNNGIAAAAAKMKEYLDQQNNTPLNIAITGESGSGKSTFINAFRDVKNRDEGAAPTGCVETTMEVKQYPHPNYPNVKLWDLPGIGTMKFPADEYLKHVGFERFDFFIIISADRFRENDVKLAKEIQRVGKKFYFVRSKIDDNMRAEKRSQREFNADTTLKQIRDNCIQGLQKEKIKSPQVFLVSSFELHLYDFHQLQETLDRELPEHKRNALLFAMPNISLEIINKKKEAFQAKIRYHASASAVLAFVPITGLSFAADVTMMAFVVKGYQVSFGLDSESLEKLALSANVPLNDLKAAMTSPLAGRKITKELIVKLLSLSASEIALMAAEEGARFIPFLGIPIAMGLSFTSTYKALSTFLNKLAEDAQRVFTKALGVNTSV